jgi:hypothetical protein
MADGRTVFDPSTPIVAENASLDTLVGYSAEMDLEALARFTP